MEDSENDLLPAHEVSFEKIGQEGYPLVDIGGQEARRLGAGFSINAHNLRFIDTIKSRPFKFDA